MVFKVNEAHLRGEDKPLEKCLIYQNEIVSSLAEKGLNFCSTDILYKLWRKLIQEKIQEDYTYASAKNLIVEWGTPFLYKERSNLLEIMKILDEAYDAVQNDIFGGIFGMTLKVKMEKFQIGFWNLKQPLIQMKLFDLRTLLIAAEPKLPESSEFYLHYMLTLFQKYKIPSRLNRLGSKSFYDASIKIDWLIFNLQGFDTFYIFWDLGWFLEKFSYVDLCDTAPKNYKIDKKFTPLDNTRH